MEALLDGTYYPWVKAFHLIFVISWMAGMLYLPRLFVYHTQVEIGSAEDERFKVMERKLMRVIINPAMILSLFFGLWLATILDAWTQPWFHAKLTCLFFMFGAHGILSKCRKAFARGENQKSERYFRVINEVPAVLMIAIVIFAVVKPF